MPRCKSIEEFNKAGLTVDGKEPSKAIRLSRKANPGTSAIAFPKTGGINARKQIDEQWPKAHHRGVEKINDPPPVAKSPTVGDLEELIAEIEALNLHIKEADRAAKTAEGHKTRLHWRRGKKLIVLQAACKHGEWLPTLALINISDRRAGEDIKIAKQYSSEDEAARYTVRQALRAFRKTSSGGVGDVSGCDDQDLLSGMKKECAEIREAEANCPGQYHRLGMFIIEQTKRFGEDSVRLMLREEGIDRTIANCAAQIAELYTYDQAAQFASARQIIKTLPQKQSEKATPKAGLAGGGDHDKRAPQVQPKALSAAEDKEAIVDTFINLGIEVRALRGDEAFDAAVAEIKAHVPETFEQAFAEV